ncbi:u8 snoRNA-decapping enzyme [Trichonephila clavata]|uniref:U8 snoRNA-decapping enzyme n=1 Tax=Trichonephila clavata TaxID=2740835 RepID=A0A8X6KX35_TRICU|nr:u8 snoRNA-decapping enzyme [Trichonephila clavata]
MDSSHKHYLSSRSEFISFQKALELTDHRHAAHCCIFAPCPTPVLQHYTSSALVSMQMRFDGLLGFHGGLVTEKDIVSGLNRELKEEINLDEKFFVTDEDYLFSYIEVPKKLCLHLYGKNVTKEDFEDIEKNVHTARDFGKETMGLFRVPMFTMDDGYYGLPAFLNNCFVGEAKNQFLNFLLVTNLLSPEEINVALKSSEKGRLNWLEIFPAYLLIDNSNLLPPPKATINIFVDIELG